jgi:hypothetical protein
VNVKKLFPQANMLNSIFDKFNIEDEYETAISSTKDAHICPQCLSKSDVYEKYQERFVSKIQNIAKNIN